MMSVDGLFGAGDTIGGSAHKFSSGSFTEGRIAGKAAVNYVNDLKSEQPQVSEKEYEDLKRVVFQPLETYRVGPQRDRRGHGLAELHAAASTVSSVSRRSWTSMSAASAPITRRTSPCSPAGWSCWAC